MVPYLSSWNVFRTAFNLTRDASIYYYRCERSGGGEGKLQLYLLILVNFPPLIRFIFAKSINGAYRLVKNGVNQVFQLKYSYLQIILTLLVLLCQNYFTDFGKNYELFSQIFNQYSIKLTSALSSYFISDSFAFKWT